MHALSHRYIPLYLSFIQPTRFAWSCAQARAAVRAHKSVAPRSPRGTRRVRAVAAATSVTESVVAAASVATAAS
eukprot:6172425-Pleurochrysis_carterae.AAC.1